MMKSQARLSLTIGTLAARTGVGIETIRYYERIGLLARPQRSQGRHRLFSQDDVMLLSFIRRGRELGFSLADVRALLTLSDTHSACQGAKAISERHLTNIREKIASLSELERALETLVDRCTPDTQSTCPIIGALTGENRP
jgi:MerR family transcriptional regulator, mercuric resistance operon regulatory protein